MPMVTSPKAICPCCLEEDKPINELKPKEDCHICKGQGWVLLDPFFSFKDYQVWTRTTAVYPKKAGLAYTLVGLGGEIGELFNKYKKLLRGDFSGIKDKNILEEKVFEPIEQEIGDILWYLARTTDELKMNLGKIAEKNVIKLENRKKENTLKGTGDNR